MDEKLTKKKFDDMIGEDKIFTEQLHRQIMEKLNHPQKVKRFNMQRFIPTVILLAFILVGGSYYFLVFSDKSTQEVNPEIPLENIPLEQSGKGNDGDSLQETPVYLAANETELSELDYEKAYELGVRALTDYYYAIRNDIDINLDTFIENVNLKQYMKKKIEEENRLWSDWSKVKTIEIGDWEIEYKDDADGGFLYLMLPAQMKYYYDGGFGEGHEFLVRNVNGKLVIADWYNGGKDSYDFLVRGANETIDNPNIWNDQEWVNNLFIKQNDY